MIDDIGTPQLADIGGFAPTDIQQNEFGLVSDTQRALLRRELNRQIVGGLIFAGMTALALVRTGLNPITVFWIIGLVVCAYQVVDFGLALRDSSATREEGDARVESTGDSESPQYVLHVGDSDLETTHDVYKRLKPGGPYRVYYHARSRRVVSIVAMDGWQPSPTVSPKKRWRFPFNIEIG